MLHWHEVGPADGAPVLHLHGTPGTGREAAVLRAAAEGCGVRLIAPDRPGMGLTPHRPGRVLADWPGDVVALADRLGLERFGLLAWSGGGPYALATLAAHPGRVTGVGLLAPAGLLAGVPLANRVLPHLYLPVHALAARVRGLTTATARARFALRHAGAPGRERALEVTPSAAAGLAEAWRQAFAQGAAGPVRDEQVINEDWSPLLGPVAAAGVPVRIWHGARDGVVPVRHSRRLAARIGAQVRDLPDAGHREALLRGGPEALAWLAALADAPDRGGPAQASSKRSMPPR